MSGRATDNEKDSLLRAVFGESPNASRYSPHRSEEEKERISTNLQEKNARSVSGGSQRSVASKQSQISRSPASRSRSAGSDSRIASRSGARSGARSGSRSGTRSHHDNQDLSDCDDVKEHSEDDCEEPVQQSDNDDCAPVHQSDDDCEKPKSEDRVCHRRRRKHCKSSTGRWWIWLIVAVITLIVIGLIVYYNQQKKKCKNTSAIGAAIAFFVVLWIVAIVWAIWK